MLHQVESHHYCSHLNEDVHQCVIYDSDRPDARLIGEACDFRMFEYLLDYRVSAIPG
jgi:hypothetical protein